jgi:hypothetical protein
MDKVQLKGVFTMSVNLDNQLPILRSFIDSELFDINLLDLIAQIGGDREIANLFHSIHFLTGFERSPFQFAHRKFAQRSADRTLEKVKSRFDASFALKQAVVELNPILLDAVLNLRDKQFIFYSTVHALLDFADQGDHYHLEKIYCQTFVSAEQHQQVVEKVVLGGHFDTAKLLLANHALPFDIGKLLGCAFRSQNWQKMIPLVHSKIPPEGMKQALFVCLNDVMQMEVDRIEIFVEYTDAKKLLTEDEWGATLAYVEKISTFLFVIDPKNEIPISFKDLSEHSINKLLYCTFGLINWEEAVPQVFSKISFLASEKKKKVLFQCANDLMKGGISQKLEFFLQGTDARDRLNEHDWEQILSKSRTRDIVLFILNPDNRIPISSQAFFNIMKSCIVYEFWNIVESMLSSNLARQDPEFLWKICLGGIDDGRKRYEIFFKNHLDKHFHWFQINCLLSRDEKLPNYFIRKAIEWNCLNILKTFIESPNAVKATYVIRTNCLSGSGYKKCYIIRTWRLSQISELCDKVNRLDLKETADQEISRREQWTTKAVLKFQAIFGSKKNIQGHFIRFSRDDD